MKKNISFNKELTFPTMIGEITSIALDNNLKFVSKNKIEGNFIVSGTYKMTEASRITEEFNYDIPTEIELNESLDLDTTNIEIDDFTYDIVNDDVLLCKIDILIDGIEEIEETEDEEEILHDIPIVVEKLEDDERACDSATSEKDLDKEVTETVEEDTEVIEETPTIELNSLFSNLNDDTFKSYTVYIVRENDTIDSILEKYKVTREELAKYNDLDNITVNSKLVIPTTNED